MNISRSRFSELAGLGLLVAAPLLLGCASSTDLIATGRIAVEPHIDYTLRRPPSVYEDKGDLVIAGRLERGLPRYLGGHMDVAVIASDGSLVYDARVNYESEASSTHDWSGPKHAEFRPVRTRSGSYSLYSVRFPGLPPEGSLVTVKHDPELHSQDAPQR